MTFLKYKKRIILFISIVLLQSSWHEIDITRANLERLHIIRAARKLLANSWRKEINGYAGLHPYIYRSLSIIPLEIMLALFLAKRYLLFYLAILPVSRHTWATKSASHNSLQHHYRRFRSRVVPAINRKRQKKKKRFVGETVFSTCA